MTLNFRSRVFLALSGLVIAAQVAGTVAVLNTTKRTVVEEATADLQVGSRVFGQLLETRAAQLLDAARVVSADYGFKQGVATGDTETIASVLINHGNRVRADLAMFVNLDGKVVAGSHGRAGDAFPFDTLLTLNRDGQSGLGSLRGSAYQLVVVPVMAPNIIGWACLGFIMDDTFAQRVAGLTSLAVSIAVELADSTQAIVASSLDTSDRRRLGELAMPPESYREPTVIALVNDQFLTLAQPLGQRIEARLQTSMSQALATYDRLRWQLVGVLLLALAVAMAIAHRISKSVTRPLTRLVAGARRIAGGEYHEPLALERQDEFGELATAFNDMQRDIGEREAKILYQSRTDALTDLPNRTVAVESVQNAIDGGNKDKPFAVLLLDLNHFKTVNDSLGYAVGDSVLQHIAQRLSSVPRRGDTVARLDGDEFLIVMQGADVERARSVAKRVIATLEEPIAVNDVQVRVSGTVGIAVWPEHGGTASRLLRRVNIALYDAKRGRQPFRAYHAGEDERQQRRIRIVQDLPDAVRADQLSLVYQPKIELGSRRVVEVEALARWIHPELGFVSPADFVPLAEQSGKVHLLTRWALTAAMNQTRLLRQQGIDITVAVNLSAYDLLDTGLPDWILNSLSERDLPPSCFGVELTESAVMSDPLQAAKVLSRLRDQGLAIAIDDFGTGYSSLAHLQKLPVTELKIDRSFITPLTGKSEAPSIVESIINLGHVMNLRVTAEGIEDEDTWWLLDGLGCDKAQGYFMSKPLAGHELVDWLSVLPVLDGVDRKGRAAHRVFELPNNEQEIA